MCNRCGRTIRQSAVPVETFGAAYGPRCAQLMGFRKTTRERLFKVRRRRQHADPRQMSIL